MGKENVLDEALRIFWATVEEAFRNANPSERLGSPYHPLKSPYHPLKSPYNELNSPYHPLRSPYHPLNGPYAKEEDRIRERQRIVNELLEKYLFTDK